jgi:hypothetical protein
MPALLHGALTVPPKPSQTHLCVDYAELLCLLDVDGTLSKSDLLDRIAEGRDISPSEEGDDERALCG